MAVEQNMTIQKPLFSGNLKVNGLLMETDTYGVRYGFIVDPASASVGFGCVVQKGASDNLVKAGANATAGATYGIATYSEAIAVSRPASNGVYLPAMPIDVLLDGYMWFYPENMAGITKTSKVCGNTQTGKVSFLAAATATDIELKFAKVVLIDELKKRVLVRVDMSRE